MSSTRTTTTFGRPGRLGLLTSCTILAAVDTLVHLPALGAERGIRGLCHRPLIQPVLAV